MGPGREGPGPGREGAGPGRDAVGPGWEATEPARAASRSAAWRRFSQTELQAFSRAWPSPLASNLLSAILIAIVKVVRIASPLPSPGRVAGPGKLPRARESAGRDPVCRAAVTGR
ncbi:hypothetical protein GCM10009665_39490 [Kitasatospora nipponensis]|uniref:Uncharacterized protein n=1 Tax=Kitasatospora nipponensis TaxID=258049 RepID=A0ABN1WFM9_9ACTN